MQSTATVWCFFDGLLLLLLLMKTTYSRYGGRTVTAVFGEMAERVRGRCASCRAGLSAPVRAGPVTVAAAPTGNGGPGDARGHGPVPHGPTMDSPVSPPLSAGRDALPYMGIKRTAPRDWSSARLPAPPRDGDRGRTHSARTVSARQILRVVVTAPPHPPRRPVDGPFAVSGGGVGCSDVSSRRDSGGRVCTM